MFETAYDNERRRTGCRLTLFGYRFYLSMDGKRVYDVEDLGKQSILRPSHPRWRHGTSGTEFELELSWPGVTTSGDDNDVDPCLSRASSWGST